MRTKQWIDIEDSLLLDVASTTALLVEPDGARNGRVLLFDDALLGEDTCFACGRRLSPARASVPSAESAEHVFPQWMLRMFGLAKESLTLLNGTALRYGQLTIPLCAGCNGGPYSRMEKAVADAVRAGPESVRALHTGLVYAWLAKLFLGVLRKETLLAANIRQPQGSRILAPEQLEPFRLMHVFMQVPRVSMSFRWRNNILSRPLENPLGSIFVYRLQPPPSGTPPFFHFRDATNLRCIALALGEVGIIAALADGGIVRACLPERFDALEQVALHPMQFFELSADLFHRAARVNLKPQYSLRPARSPAGLSLPGVDVRLERFLRRDNSLTEPLRPFIEEEYKTILRFCTGAPDPLLFDEAGHPRTTLFTHGASGEVVPKLVSREVFPWPPDVPSRGPETKGGR